MTTINETPVTLGEFSPDDTNPTHVAQLDSNGVLQWAKYTKGISIEYAADAKAVASKNERDMADVSTAVGNLEIGRVSADGVIHDLGENQELGHLTDTNTSETLASILRWMGGSGLVGVRQNMSNPAFDAFNRKHDTPAASMNLHEHSNYQLMPGLGELGMIVNGYYYQSRHNDYIMRLSIPGEVGEFKTEDVQPPVMPASVAAKATGVSGATVDLVGDTQARWLSRVAEDNPEEVKMYLAYAEVFWQILDGNGATDLGSSFRHSNSEEQLRVLQEKATRLAALTTKDRLENTPFTPISKRQVNVDGTTVTAYLNFRIMTHPIGTQADVGVFTTAPQITIIDNDSHGHMLDSPFTFQQASDLKDATETTITLTSTDSGHLHSYEITWDGTKFVGVDTNVTHQHEVRIEFGYDGALPFDEAKCAAGILDNENVFKMVDNIARPAQYDHYENDEYLTTRAPRFTLSKMERICERIPGLDGDGASIREFDIHGQLSSDRDGGILNAAYYSHTFTRALNDAMGLGGYMRGLNDPNLFTALTENPAVLDGVSYMIPLEIVAVDAVHSWNPYDVAIGVDKPTSLASGQGSEADPYDSIHPNGLWYAIPEDFFIGDTNIDPADTGTSVWVRDSSGTARLCASSGIRPFTPSGRRVRFPVYSVFQEFSYEGVRVNRISEDLNAIGKIQRIDGAGEAQGSVELKAIVDAILPDTGAQLHVYNTAATTGEPTTVRYYWGAVSDGASGETPSWIPY